MTPTKHRSAAAALLVAVALTISGCGLRGLNDYVLPGAKGSGDDGYEITVELETAANLVPNAEVKVADVTVGTVRRIRLDGWRAVAVVSVTNDVRLSADARARIAQKSLLGAEYLELDGPVGDGRSLLKDGDTIPLARSGRYPETEEVLSAVSTLLNGGGIANLITIVKEVNRALDGNTGKARALVENLGSLLSSVREQKDELVGLVDALDRLTVRLARQSETLGDSIGTVSRGIQVLSDQRTHLTGALASLDRLSRLGSQVIARDGSNIEADVHQLSKALASLDKAGAGLPGSLDLIGTVLFPISGVPYVTKGDYLNFAATLDLSVPALATGLFPDLARKPAVSAILQSLGLATPPAALALPKAPKPGVVQPGTTKPNLLGSLLGLGGPGTKEPASNGLADLLGQILGSR